MLTSEANDVECNQLKTVHDINDGAGRAILCDTNFPEVPELQTVRDVKGGLNLVSYLSRLLQEDREKFADLSNSERGVLTRP